MGYRGRHPGSGSLHNTKPESQQYLTVLFHVETVIVHQSKCWKKSETTLLLTKEKGGDDFLLCQ